jgi:nucleoside-diphosphate-sugar epimerase
MTHGFYNLGGGRENAISLREIIDRVGEMIQCQPIFDESASVPPPVPLNYISDLSRIAQELSWRPETGVDEGLRDLI